MTVELIYETHLISADSEARIATGWLPARLSAPGRQGVAELGERRRNGGLAAVFVSDLHRVAEAVEIAIRETSTPVSRDRRMPDGNHDDLNGCPLEVVGAKRRRHIDEPFPGGQSYRRVVTAPTDPLLDLADGSAWQRVLPSRTARTEIERDRGQARVQNA